MNTNLILDPIFGPTSAVFCLFVCFFFCFFFGGGGGGGGGEGGGSLNAAPELQATSQTVKNQF